MTYSGAKPPPSNQANLGKLLVEALLKFGGQFVKVRPIHVVRHAIGPNQLHVFGCFRLKNKNIEGDDVGKRKKRNKKKARIIMID